MKMIAITLASLLLAATAHAQGVSTNRAYQLCQIEDPSCMSNLRTIYRAAVAKNATLADPFFCKTAPGLTDRQIYNFFMQGVTQHPDIVTVSALDAELAILGMYIYHC